MSEEPTREPPRVVVLTGAAGGIGRAITWALLERGHLIAAVDRDAESLARLAADQAEAIDSGQLYSIQADLAKEAACVAAVESAAAHFGRIEAVINNAGISVSSLRPDAERNHPSIEELSAEIWDRFYATNLRGPVLVAQAALPHLRRAGWGRIVNNTTSYLTMLRVLPYGGLKAALEATSAVWAKELSDSNITVNVLIPGGPTDTPFIADEAGIPRDQMLRPEVLGPPACWLMSNASDDVTGQRIIAARWDPDLPPAEAAEAASRAIGWPELGVDVVWPGGGPE